MTLSPHAVSSHVPDFARGVWRLVDPKIALASIVPFGAAFVVASTNGRVIEASLVVAAYLALFAVEVGKNAVNDLYDFRSGTDSAVLPEERSPFSGGKRVMVDGLLDERELVQIAALAFLLAAALGVYAAFGTDPRLLWLGCAGALIAIEYTAPPLKLSYRGLGELAVLLTYGPGIFIGAMWMLGSSPGLFEVTASLSLGLIIANVLLINEVPDARADAAAGKRTLVVRLGRGGSTRLFGAAFALAFAGPIVVAASGGGVELLGLLAGAPFAWHAVVRLSRTPQGPPVDAQAFTLLTYVTAGAGLAVAAVVL